MSFHVYELTFILSCTLFGVSWTNDFSADIGDQTAVVRFSGSKTKKKKIENIMKLVVFRSLSGSNRRDGWRGSK